ncbi:MAG: NAD(P)/FAD-dependent oxidoreductase [Candidatus Methanoperedens sp.]|nr:NAD(P)/FAD-dependent oxidoreductase [Candidatus Methanoperedens sp.]
MKQEIPVITPEICLTCRTCVGICPMGAISQLRREMSIDHSTCNRCGICVQWCPAKAISFHQELALQKTPLRKINAPQHLNKIYDLIIVGGGIAGLSTAIGALQKEPELKVLVLDRKRKVGEDINSSAGTWYFTLDMLPLSHEERAGIILQKFTKFGFAVEKESVVLDIGKAFLETIDLSRLMEVLSDKLLGFGAQIETNSFVDNIENTDTGFIINIISNGVTYQIRSMSLVDATGIDAGIFRKLGFARSWDPNLIGVGAEYEMTWSGDPEIIWFIRMKHRNLGYAWSFPIGNRLSRIGVAALINAFKYNKIVIQEELESFINSHFLIRENTKGQISRTNFKCGAYPMMRMEDKIISDRILRVGDAASQANPFLGEGIYYAIKYGLKAGEVLAGSKNGNVAELKPYEDFVLADKKKFEEDKIGYNVDYDRVLKKLNEIKDKLSDKEKWAFLSFIMPLESNWNSRLQIAVKLLGYGEAMKLFGSIARRKIMNRKS